MNSITLLYEKICKYSDSIKELDKDELQNDLEEIYATIKFKSQSDDNSKVLTKMTFSKDCTREDVVAGLTKILQVVCEQLNVPMPKKA